MDVGTIPATGNEFRLLFSLMYCNVWICISTLPECCSSLICNTITHTDIKIPGLTAAIFESAFHLFFKPDSPLQRQSTILKTYYLIVRLLAKTLRYCQEKCLCFLEKKNHSSGLILLSSLSPYYFCGWKAFCFSFLQFVMLYSVIS